MHQCSPDSVNTCTHEPYFLCSTEPQKLSSIGRYGAWFHIPPKPQLPCSQLPSRINTGLPAPLTHQIPTLLIPAILFMYSNACLLGTTDHYYHDSKEVVCMLKKDNIEQGNWTQLQQKHTAKDKLIFRSMIVINLIMIIACILKLSFN